MYHDSMFIRVLCSKHLCDYWYVSSFPTVVSGSMDTQGMQIILFYLLPHVIIDSVIVVIIIIIIIIVIICTWKCPRAITWFTGVTDLSVL